MVRSARAEENRGMHLRILPRNAAGVRNGTSLPLEKHPTPRGIKSFGIRVYATATVQSVVADFYLSMFPREETSSRDARLNNEITAYSNYFPLPSSFSRCLLSDQFHFHRFFKKKSIFHLTFVFEPGCNQGPIVAASGEAIRRRTVAERSQVRLRCTRRIHHDNFSRSRMMPRSGNGESCSLFLHIHTADTVQGGNGGSMGNLTRASPEWVIIGDDRPSGARRRHSTRRKCRPRGSLPLQRRVADVGDSSGLISIYVWVTSIQTGRCRGRCHDPLNGLSS